MNNTLSEFMLPTIPDKRVLQGSYRSWKTWKVLEFCFGIFAGLESPGKRPLVLESSGNLLNSSKTYEMYGRQ